MDDDGNINSVTYALQLQKKKKMFSTSKNFVKFVFAIK